MNSNFHFLYIGWHLILQTLVTEFYSTLAMPSFHMWQFLISLFQQHQRYSFFASSEKLAAACFSSLRECNGQCGSMECLLSVYQVQRIPTYFLNLTIYITFSSDFVYCYFYISNISTCVPHQMRVSLLKLNIHTISKSKTQIVYRPRSLADVDQHNYCCFSIKPCQTRLFLLE